MSTKLVNVNYEAETTAFLLKEPPESIVPILYAILESVQRRGNTWLRTDQAKSMLFMLLLLSYGSRFKLDSSREMARLALLFSKAVEIQH